MLRTSTIPIATLLLRVSLGTLFLAHVWLKIFVISPSNFVAYFASMDIPAAAAYATIVLELVGGLALILGVYVPLVAIPLGLELLGTIVLVHGSKGWLFTSKGGGWEYPAFWATTLVVLFLLGDGPWALRPLRREKSTLSEIGQRRG
ncbi:DoxX family protein [Paraburkholderia nemoris]|uniref:DoxX family protein n=1 Tax=Paraburkholderia nemoris TaxID=2793076 RepID=UPI0038BA76C1